MSNLANQPEPFELPAFDGWIGVAREDITPPVGIYARNWGAADHDIAEGIHKPLTVTALTLQRESDDRPSLLAAMDLGWWRRGIDEWRLRSAVIDALSLDPAGVLLSFSHTHSGPAICADDADQPGGDLIAPYLDRLANAVIDAARHALQNARPSVLTWTYGRCSLAQHRDLPDPDRPRVVCGYNPSQPADDTLLIGRVTSAHGDPVAILVNYACHPVTLAWQNRLISPDFVGALRETVETHADPALCLFLQGASGELAPREQYSADTALADRHGRELGFAALAAVEGMLPARTRLEYSGVVESGAPLAAWRSVPANPSPGLRMTCVEVELPLKEMPSIAEIDALIAGCTDRAQQERLRRKRRVRETVGAGAIARVPLWIWRIGDAALVAHPNEAYSALQTTLRARFPTIPIAVMNVTNGHIGYLPPAELYDLDLYQVWQTPFERGCLERLIEAAEAGIRRLFEMGTSA